MIDDYILKSMLVDCYRHKEGTATSYYCTTGTTPLPSRLSISRGNEMTSVQRKGRNILHPVVGQLLGKFRVAEESSLKHHKPYSVRTQLWQVPLYPAFIGYGTIGITDDSGKVADTGNLVVLYSTDEWETITIFYFSGMGNPNDLPQVMKFLNGYVEDEGFNKGGNASQQPLPNELKMI